MSRVPFVFFLIFPLCVWPTSFTKSVFQNKPTTARYTTRSVIQSIPQRPYVLPMQCGRHLFLGTSSLGHSVTIRLSIVLRFCAVDLASVSLRNSPITQVSVSSLVSALSCCHTLVKKSCTGRTMTDSRQTTTGTIHRYSRTDVIRTTANTMTVVTICTAGLTITTAFCLTSQLHGGGSFFRS
jgi:hypothetical protein